MTEFKPGDRVRWVYNDMREGVVVGADDPETGTVRVCWGTGTYAHVRSHLAGELLELISRPEPTALTQWQRDLLNHHSEDGGTTAQWVEDHLWDAAVDTPATDPVGTVRVHPEDDPEDPNARRVFRRNEPFYESVPWRWFTSDSESRAKGFQFTHSHVTDWPRQSLADVARVLGHVVPSYSLAEIQEMKYREAFNQERDRAERLERERDRDNRHNRQEYDALSKAYDELERERDEARDEVHQTAEDVEFWTKRAEKAERDHRLTRNALDSAYSEIRELKDQVRGMAIDAMTVDNQAMENYDRAILAEKRAASHWESAKQYCRAMNNWVDISITDAESVRELSEELYELKKALRTLGS